MPRWREQLHRRVRLVNHAPTHTWNNHQSSRNVVHKACVYHGGARVKIGNPQNRSNWFLRIWNRIAVPELFLTHTHSLNSLECLKDINSLSSLKMLSWKNWLQDCASIWTNCMCWPLTVELTCKLLVDFVGQDHNLRQMCHLHCKFNLKFTSILRPCTSHRACNMAKASDPMEQGSKVLKSWPLYTMMKRCWNAPHNRFDHISSQDCACWIAWIDDSLNVHAEISHWKQNNNRSNDLQCWSSNSEHGNPPNATTASNVILQSQESSSRCNCSVDRTTVASAVGLLNLLLNHVNIYGPSCQKHKVQAMQSFLQWRCCFVCLYQMCSLPSAHSQCMYHPTG